METRNKAIEKVINSLIEQVLSDKNFSWKKMWQGYTRPPHNPFTRNQYKGVNRFILQMYASKYGTSRFATANNIKKNKGSFKGLRAIPIIKAERCYIINGKFIPIWNKKKLSGYTKEQLADFPCPLCITNFWVFPLIESTGLYEPEAVVDFKTKPIAKAEKVLKVWTKNECAILKGNDRAFYSPQPDTITLPDIKQFESSESYYLTAFHEIGHATGHKDRLKRDLSGMFGNDKYAKEELIAELTACMLGANIGLLSDFENSNSAGYLQGWVKRATTKDKYRDGLYKAFTGASKAFEYINKIENENY